MVSGSEVSRRDRLTNTSACQYDLIHTAIGKLLKDAFPAAQVCTSINNDNITLLLLDGIVEPSYFCSLWCQPAHAGAK